MPIFEFKCTKCGAEFEKICFGADKENPVPCPNCRSKKTRKLMSAFAGGKAGCGSCAATSCAPS